MGEGVADALTVVVADPPQAIDTAPRSLTTAELRLAPAIDSLRRQAGCIIGSPSCLHRLPCAPLAPTPTIVHWIDGDSARDAIDAGADVVVTRNPTAIAYAARRRDLASIPLRWDRVYVLLLPAGHDVGGASMSDSAVGALDVLQSSLVANVVRTESRPAAWERWRDADAQCASASLDRPAIARSTPGNGPRLALRVVYAQSDSVARSLAERLAATARTDSASPLGGATGPRVPGNDMRAVGLLPAAFAQAVVAGADAGYVLGLPADSATPCQRRALATAMAPWVVRGDAGVPIRLLPLVETRPRAIVRDDAAQRIVDHLGGGRPDPVGRAEP